MFSEKGKRLRVINYFKFRFHKPLANGVDRWSCTNRRCSAYFKVLPSGEMKEENLQHNHMPEPDRKLIRERISNSAKRKAMVDLNERPRKVIKKEMDAKALNTLTPMDVKFIRNNIGNARRKVHPTLPKTLAELHAAINEMTYQTTLEENFVLVNNPTTNVLIFSTDKNIVHLQQCDALLVDGTFYSAPTLFKQLFTIHGFKDQTYTPLVFCLLPDKTTSSYKHAFQELRTFLKPNYVPPCVYVDFEDGIHTALRSVWHDEITIRGCRFHLGQAWFRAIQRFGLQKVYSSRDERGSFLRNFFGLPFLKPEDVDDCFVNDLMPDMPSDEAIVKFADYVLDNYIAPESSYPPTLWASLSAEDIRTTNACEAFHSKLNGMFYHPHPNIFILIDALLEIQDWSYIKMRGKGSRKKDKDDFIASNIRKVTTGEISRYDFVKTVSRKFLPPKIK